LRSAAHKSGAEVNKAWNFTSTLSTFR